MISGIRTTPLGNEVVQAFVNDNAHRLLDKVSQRDITFMATCCRPTFTTWNLIAAQLPKWAEPRHLNAVATKLEKLGLIECDRPVAKPGDGKHVAFGFDKEGNHRWVF